MHHPSTKHVNFFLQCTTTAPHQHSSHVALRRASGAGVVPLLAVPIVQRLGQHVVLI